MNIENYSVSQVFGNAALKAQFLKDYKAMFGKEVCSTCSAELKNAFYEYRTKKNNSNMNAKPLYTLKKGKKLNVLDYGYISEANFTDEIAEALLARNKAYLDYMETYPDDWQERVNGTVPEKTPQATPVEETPNTVHTNIPPAAAEEPAEEIKASDAAKKLAKEHGIELSAIKGSGAGGNITKADVQAAIG